MNILNPVTFQLHSFKFLPIKQGSISPTLMGLLRAFPTYLCLKSPKQVTRHHNEYYQGLHSGV